MYIYIHIIYTIYYIYIIYNNLKTIRCFIKNIFMTLSDGYKNQSDLLIEIIDSNKDTKPKNMWNKNEKRHIHEGVNALYDCREMVLDVFKIRILPLATTNGAGLKTLTPKHMLQNLAIAIVQVQVWIDQKIYQMKFFRTYNFCIKQKITKTFFNNVLNLT